MSDFVDLDFYELLGVPRTATQEEIKRAYRREIAKYHPDRFVNAAPEQQQYAQERSQRLTEAYATLNDFAARTLYNAGQKPAARSTPRPMRQTPPQNRDHQAELYDQAVAHLEAGRTLQAIGVLRQLQQLNPFYRDSSDLLTKAEAQAASLQAGGNGNHGKRRPLVLLGGIGGVALIGLAAWALAQRATNQTGVVATPPAAVALSGTSAATTSLPEPTAPLATPMTPADPPTQVVPTEPQPTNIPTEQPTNAPTTVTPSETPTDQPTETPEPAPATLEPLQEPGQLLLADNFSTAGWADISGRNWNVGYSGERYRITVNPGIGTIWSYRTAGRTNYSIGVDVQVIRGEGGLMLSFVNEDSYLSFVVNPAQTSYRLEQHDGRGITVLSGGQNEAILEGSEAINRLTARLNGDRLQLRINNQQVAEVDISNVPRSPRYGLLSISGASAADAFFDNLEIRAVE